MLRPPLFYCLLDSKYVYPVILLSFLLEITLTNIYLNLNGLSMLKVPKCMLPVMTSANGLSTPLNLSRGQVCVLHYWMLGSTINLRPCFRIGGILSNSLRCHHWQPHFGTLTNVQCRRYPIRPLSSNFFYHRRVKPWVDSISTRRHNSTRTTSTINSSSHSPRRNLRTSFLLRLLPSRLFSNPSSNVSSFRKIIALARPERKPLLIAIGLLFISSAVSMSIPFTVGRLIDFFSSPNPVRFDLLTVFVWILNIPR